MDDTSPAGHDFPSNAPIRYTITIIHLFTISTATFGFYPYAIIQRMSRTCQIQQRLVFLGLGWIFVLVGFVTGWFIPYSSSTSDSVFAFHIGLFFCILLITSLDLGLHYLHSGLSGHQRHLDHNNLTTFQERENEHEQQSTPVAWHSTLVYKVPEMANWVLPWIAIYFGCLYLISCVLVFTSSCSSLGQCWLPLSTGTGFLFYGSLAFMHLGGLLSLPQSSSPEYYEALGLLLWGLVSFIWWDSLLVGSSWKVINLSLLWSTGGLLSLAVTYQEWIPFLKKRNIVNSIVLCLTGKGILAGQVVDDPYAMQLQSMLGYILMTGGTARFIQIIFRKSPTEDLPRLYSRASGGNCDDSIEGDPINDLDLGQQRAAEYESTYRQLTGMDSSSKCKHQIVYASITMVCGLLFCYTAISGGLLFIGTIVDWVESMRYYISDPTIYVNVLLAISFLWTVYLVIMCTLYMLCAKQSDKYDYMNLASGDYGDQFAPTVSRTLSTHLVNNTVMTTTMAAPTCSTSTKYGPTSQHQQQKFTSVPLVPLTSTASLSSLKSTGTPTSPVSASPPLMRPSQYRAKRRSLLISTSMHNNSQDNNKSGRGPRTLSSSSYSGVGGVLPDAVPLYMDDQPTLSPLPSTSPTMINDTLQQSGTSSPCGTFSTMTNTSITTIGAAQCDHWLSQEDDILEDRMVHKTESGKRKDRQWMKSKRRRATVTGVNGYTFNTNDDGFSSSNNGHERLAYYSSERNNSDSHVP
ncbi:hypothetical protein BC941DRAFT_421537 [Chlamydoabsidia padenii]|nr:hypothetical protein BC941DRAFT_421537 [Chlamydoabsidia padenii]